MTPASICLHHGRRTAPGSRLIPAVTGTVRSTSRTLMALALSASAMTQPWTWTLSGLRCPRCVHAQGENADDVGVGVEKLTARWTQRVGRRRLLRGAGVFGAGVALASVLGCRGEGEEALTTLDRTIVLGMDGVLRPGPGEPHP